MKRMTTTVMGLSALVVMLVLGVFSAGVAQAHTFEFSGATPSLLLILGDGPQLFAVTPNVEIICSHVRLDGKINTAKQVTVKVAGNYTGCEALGFAVSITEAEYELSAEETVSVLKGILIEVAGICVIHIFTTNNQNLSKIRYLVDPLSSLRILAHAEVEKIHSIVLGGGSLCGGEGLHNAGVYRGLLLAWVHSPGTLKWA